MNRGLFIFIGILIAWSAQAQNRTAYFKTVPSDISNAPNWARLMYSDDPDVREVDFAYYTFYQNNPFEKTIHTQNFKHWMMMVNDKVGENGRINDTPFGLAKRPVTTGQKQRAGTSDQIQGAGVWRQIGPLQTFTFPEQGGEKVSWQANVYCFDQCVSQPEICFAGIEGGGLYKSVNKGNSWEMVTRDVSMNTIDDVKVAPSDARIIYFTSSDWIYKSSNGGFNWEKQFDLEGRGFQLLVHPSDPDKVFCASESGFFRSIDGGSNWVKVFNQKSWDVNFKPSNPDIVYLLKTNATAKQCEFFKSIDGGESFELKEAGWFKPTDLATASDIGARMGVTPADPERVYVGLIGESKADDNGWIGVYRSDDCGESWANNDLPDGGPYNENGHYNLASINRNGTGFHQGFFNYALAVSHHDADLLWVGTLSLNKSSDGGQSWTRIGAYNSQEDIGWVHPDIQDLHVLGSDVWVCTDGGISLSTDQLRTHSSRNQGLAGSNLWGLGQGWNEDVLVGGRYHNGNFGYHENYGNGNSLRLGGAESPTGYVNPQYNRKTYFSDISTQILPSEISGKQTSLPKLSRYPNEAYTESTSSEMEFDPRYSNHIYIGNGGGLYKSINGGGYFELLHSFGNTARVLEIEISRSNPNVIYVVSQPGGGYWDASYLYKSADGGKTFNRTISIPASSRWRTEITLNPDNENELWAMSITGSNNRKVYRTLDGGESWENMTSDILDNHRPQDIQYQAGSGGIVYLATSGGMFYYDPEQTEWIDFSEGLPLHTRALEMKPFYAKNLIRLGTEGHAVWEIEMVKSSSPIAQPMTHTDTVYRALDTVYFDSYSVIEREGAQYEWKFIPEPQFVSGLTERNPKVVFGVDGSYDVSLSILDRNGFSDTKTEEAMLTVMDISGVDSIAGKAMETFGSGDYMVTEDFGINTEVFTITAWVKPDGIQSDYSGIVLNNGESAGMNFRGGNNTLGYHWPDGSWSWNSGLIVEPHKWSHVAIVVDKTRVSLFVNGVGSTHQTDVSSVYLSSFNIGSYKGWDSRNFVGSIDEVCFWKKALTEEDIRLGMHLTKEGILDDPDLLSYYQFNEPSGQVLDKIGDNHGSIYGNSVRISSSAPVGKGESSQMTLDFGGDYVFGSTGVTLGVPVYGTKPGAEVLVTRLDALPSMLPSEFPNAGIYWIIDDFGDGHFSALDKIKLTVLSEPSQEIVENPEHAILYKRRASYDFSEWQNLCGAKEVTGVEVGEYRYDASCQITGFGEFIIVSDDQDIPLLKSQSTGVNVVESMSSSVKVYPNPVKRGQSITIDTGSDRKIRIKLYSVEGKLIFDRFLDGKQSYQIDLSNISGGLYYYTVSSIEFIKNGQLVVE